MAMVDDPEWLLSHIQHSFITSDDTGMCEMVIQSNDLFTLDEHRERIRRKNEKLIHSNSLFSSPSASKEVVENPSAGEETSNSEPLRAPSPDILSGWDFGVRRRSNTAQKLERIRKERQNRIKIKTVHWKQMPEKFVNEKLENMFEKKDYLKSMQTLKENRNSADSTRPSTLHTSSINESSSKQVDASLLAQNKTESPSTKKLVASFKGFEILSDSEVVTDSVPNTKPKTKSSALSKLMEQSVEVTPNPFKEYAKFDGRGHEGSAGTQHIGMFVYVYGEPAPRFSINVVVLTSGAKIQDLIGLTCWRYCLEKVKPELKRTDVQGYSLYIAEDDGEVDYGFPPLESNEPVSKFSFPILALVEKHQVADDSEEDGKFRESVFVKVHDHTGFSLIQVEDLSIAMGEILKKAIKRRKGNRFSGVYQLEFYDKPGVLVDENQTLDSTGVMEFCMVREHSVRSSHNYPVGGQKRRSLTRLNQDSKSHGTTGKSVQFMGLTSLIE